jgi:hypothetical protein
MRQMQPETLQKNSNFFPVYKIFLSQMTMFVVHSHNPVLLYSLMTYHRIFDECNTTDATRPKHLIPQRVFVGLWLLGV